jgi:hypothetical protein
MQSDMRLLSDSNTDGDMHPGAQAPSANETAICPFNTKDWLWVLGLPIYILIGTARHEFSHALAATLEGAHVEKIRLIPTLKPGNHVLWGYVNWTGTTTWISLAAPYFCDLATFLLGLWILNSRLRMPHWLSVQVFVIGVLSPAINSLYNYLAVLRNPSADVARILTVISPVWVAAWMVLSLSLYGVGILAVVRPHATRSPVSIREAGES